MDTVPPRNAINGRRSHQPGYQEPLTNTSRDRVQRYANGQQSESRHPYVNARGMHATPNLTSALNSTNYHAQKPPPALQSPYANFSSRNQNQHAQHPRPVSLNRQLYEPNNPLPQIYNRYQTQDRFHMSDASIRAQALFLEQLACVEIPKAAISSDELQEKEALRLVLEGVCRKTITEHERKKDDGFDEKLVTLKCFGSLASGFATHSADMDLALVSPQSKPESSSPESEIPRLLEKALLDLGYGVRLLTRTRVPIIKFCEKPTLELAAKLLEERAKYEKERDAPPKPKKAKKTEDSKNATKKEKPPTTDEIAHDHAQTTAKLEVAEKPLLEPTPNLNDPVDTDFAKAKAIDASATKQVDVIGSTETAAPSTNEIDAKIDELKHSSAADVSGIPVPAQEVNNVEEQRIQASEDPKVAAPVVVEKVTDLSLFSDEELVRLYDLAIKEGWYEPAERAIIIKFKIAVGKHGPNSSGEDLTTARSNLHALTDVLKRYRAPPEHHLDFPKIGVGIQCDINFSNQLALHNTRLLKCYGLCDKRVRPMVLFVKAWAKRRKINSPYHGTLSSYGYVLMVLHYLVNVAQPPVAPNLQVTRKALQDKSPENDIMIDGCNVRFWRSEDEIMDLAKRGMLTHNREDTVGSLLRGFYQYFAHGYSGFSWSTDVLSLRTEGGLLPKAQKGWTGAKTVISEPTAPGQEQKEIRHRYLFAVEDPFELDHNVARTVVHNGIVAIRDEFRRAHAIIQSAGFWDGRSVDDLFAEAESKENLQYRAFGPMPRKDNVPTKREPKETNGLSTDKAKGLGSAPKNGKGTPKSVGNIGEVGTISKAHVLPKNPNAGSAPTNDGLVRDPKKSVTEMAQPQVNGKVGQVTPKKQSLPPKPSVGGDSGKEKVGPVQKEVRSTGSTQANIREGGVTPKKKARRVKQAARSEPVKETKEAKEREVGSVYKNGKEVAGSSGRIGEAGVIPRRPEANTMLDVKASSGTP